MSNKSIFLSIMFTFALLCIWAVPSHAIKSSVVTDKLSSSWAGCFHDRQSCSESCFHNVLVKEHKPEKYNKCVEDCEKEYDNCNNAGQVIKKALKKTKDKKKRKKLEKIADSWEKADDKCANKYSKELNDYKKGKKAEDVATSYDLKAFKCYRDVKNRWSACL